MSIGNFKEISESNEVNEAGKNIDNTEKPRNQILEIPESYDDDFDTRLDNNDRENESKRERKNGNEKTSLLDKMRALFSKKESGEEFEISSNDGQKSNAENNSADRRSNFIDNLRKDAPSMEEQVKNAKELPNGKDYVDAREKSEQAKKDYPDMKNWELSPEQLSEIRQGQSEITNGASNERLEKENKISAEGRTPGGDAWERRFGHIEGED